MDTWMIVTLALIAVAGLAWLVMRDSSERPTTSTARSEGSASSSTSAAPAQPEPRGKPLRESIPSGMQEGIFGDGTYRAVQVTPDYKIRVGDQIRYCGVRRTVGESGQVLEVYSDGGCVVRWRDGSICLHGDHLVSKN